MKASSACSSESEDKKPLCTEASLWFTLDEMTEYESLVKKTTGKNLMHQLTTPLGCFFTCLSPVKNFSIFIPLPPTGSGASFSIAN